jgi:hypothetical protein
MTISLTTLSDLAIVLREMGGSVRHVAYVFVLLLLTAVVGVSAIPQTDRPETSYNEVDTPINQAPPVVQGIRFARPTRVAILVPRRALEERRTIEEPTLERPSLGTPSRHSHSLQDLLCTLLI